MADPTVFFVHLRRPRASDPRTDPMYEFGSFGCTGCHSTNLFHPRHAERLQSARLAFVQGGALGFRLVLLTPPITVYCWADRCEARWAPAEMPFKYSEAPILACNDSQGDFPLVERFARATNRSTVEGGLSSRLRSRARPLPVELANEVIRVYESLRAVAPPSAIAATYDEALPYTTQIDRNRKETYRRLLRELAAEVDDPRSGCDGGSPVAETQDQLPCGLSLVERSERRTNCCN
jgi:hypothetical protein